MATTTGTPMPSAPATPTASLGDERRASVTEPAVSELADKSVELITEVNVVSDVGPLEEEDEGFGSKMAYILTLVGYAVGFGNIWRFPYLIQENGGVAFLVPYCLMLTFLGIPTFFLELAIGQRLRKGPVGTWNEISPYLGGIGIMCGCICFIVGMYYTTLIAWCLSYLFDIFRARLRWSTCELAVSTKKISCDEAVNSTIKLPNSTIELYNERTRHGITLKEACGICKSVGPSQYYWNYEVLDISNSISEPGNFNPYVLLYLIIAWTTVWAILVKGLKATGKVVYFTALFPYAVLLIFLIFGLTLDGMENGFKVLFTPNWSKLLEGKVWMQAGTQIFFSLGLGFGVLIAFASHLPSNNNCYRDAITVALINCSTSLFASVVIFAILGFQGTKLFNTCLVKRKDEFQKYLLFNSTGIGMKRPTEKFELDFYDCDGLKLEMDHHGIIRDYALNGQRHLVPIEFQNAFVNNFTNCSIANSLKGMSGTGLVFVVFADAIAQLPGSQFWALLFYTMLFTLGIDSAFSTVEGAIACLLDLKFNIKRWVVTTVICSILMVSSVLFAFGWGAYVLTFMDEFNANWGLLIVAFFECVGIAWVYGLKKFAYDIKLMTGHRPNIFLMICWKVISPLLMLGLMIASIVGYLTKGIRYDVWVTEKETSNASILTGGKKDDEKYPRYVVGIGFAMLVFSIMWIPILAFLKFINRPLLRAEVPAFFPEEELREQRNITSDDNEEENYTQAEKLLFWGQRSQAEIRNHASITETEEIGSYTNLGSGSGATVTSIDGSDAV